MEKYWEIEEEKSSSKQVYEKKKETVGYMRLTFPVSSYSPFT